MIFSADDMEAQSEADQRVILRIGRELARLRALIAKAAAVGVKFNQPDKFLDEIARDRADWLIDGAAMASQNRILLRGDDAADDVLIEAIEINARQAIRVAIERALAALLPELRAELGKNDG